MELKQIKGLGEKTIKLLNKININTPNDLMMHYPFRYDVLKRTDLKDINEDNKIIIDGKVDSVPMSFYIKKGLSKLSFRMISSYNTVIGVVIFNRSFLKNSLRIGESIVVIGKINKKQNIIVATDIKITSLGNSTKIEPVYHCTSGISNKMMSLYVNNALLCAKDDLVDLIPSYLIEKYNFLNKRTALNIVHNPSTLEKMKEATIRLKYEELFEFMFKINYLKLKNGKNALGIKRDIDITYVDQFIENLPFKLTDDQSDAVYEIINDLVSEKRMNRLLQGDVGSGKTIVAIIAMYANYLSHYQSALMAPTEILAVQHYNNIKEIFKGYNINIGLLTGSITKKERKLLVDGLFDGKIDILVGTHALIQDDVNFHNLGLVVTDEQHRFGVNQRGNLKNKGITPDVLYMSATPIPRTYALTIYGDMDITSIKQMPSGRIPVKTFLKREDEMKEVLSMIYAELQMGHQIYVISSLIESEENTESTNVLELKEKMEEAFGKRYVVDVIHGKMDSKCKDLVMGDFKAKRIDILISTTVIEVGVDVPNASMIVIFDADRFGLSTLHQLRGRVGRGLIESKCILISNSDTKRLQVMCSTNDGFLISEEDFKLRGSGDLFGTKQSGDMEFKIADIRRDYKILVQAKNDAIEFLEKSSVDTDNLKNMLINRINGD